MIYAYPIPHFAHLFFQKDVTRQSQKNRRVLKEIEDLKQILAVDLPAIITFPEYEAKGIQKAA